MLREPLSSCTSMGLAKAQEPLEREQGELFRKLWVMPTGSWDQMGSCGSESVRKHRTISLGREMKWSKPSKTRK